MFSLLQKAIIETLVYADLFDYPLSFEELLKYLVKPIVEDNKLRTEVEKMKVVQKKRRFYFLEGREKIVEIRKKREKWSKKKIKIVQKVASLLKIIPTIKLIGITGTLAVGNSKENDDMDLFIVASAGLLWMTRFFVTIFVELTGKRRHPKEEYVKNKICLNMFVDEKHLAVDFAERNFFSAHEVVQMKPIWNKDDTYERFLRANLWVRDYLPNAFLKTEKISNLVPTGDRKIKQKNKQLLYCFELIFKKLQLWYMRKRRTAEVIKNGVIRFHPQDAGEWILRNYKAKLEAYDGKKTNDS